MLLCALAAFSIPGACLRGMAGREGRYLFQVDAFRALPGTLGPSGYLGSVWYGQPFMPFSRISRRLASTPFSW